MFEGDYRLVHHLAPPLTARRNDKGELVKQPYGPWMRRAFVLLAKMKGLRGGALDLFGRSEERRTERALIQQYRDCIEELLKTLDAGKLGLPAEATWPWPPRSRAFPRTSAATAMSRSGT